MLQKIDMHVIFEYSRKGVNKGIRDTGNLNTRIRQNTGKKAYDEGF